DLVGEVLAGLAEANPLAFDRADPESPTDQVVQADAARRDVPPRLAGHEADPIPIREGIDLLALDQGQLAIGARVRRIRSAVHRVTVAVEPDAGDCPSPRDGRHRSARDVGEMDGLDPPWAGGRVASR